MAIFSEIAYIIKHKLIAIDGIRISVKHHLDRTQQKGLCVRIKHDSMLSLMAWWMFNLPAQALTNLQAESVVTTAPITAVTMSATTMTEGDAMAQRMDTDGDGKISYDEFKAERLRQIDQQFQFLDVNHDGYIDAVEKSLALDKVKKQLKQLREQRIKPNPTSP